MHGAAFSLPIRALATRLLPVLLTLAVVATACGSNRTPSPKGPADAPPWGLQSIDLPNDVTAVEAVFAAMPERVAGLARLEGGPNEADYEGDALVTVMSLSGPTEDVSATSALEFLRSLSRAGEMGEIEMELEQLAEDARLVYVVYNTIGNGRRVYLVSWGAPHSEFLFGVKAESPDARTALVRAFVEVSSSA
jgi:hypothetical protein